MAQVTNNLILKPMTPENITIFRPDLIRLYQDPEFLRFLGEADYGNKPFTLEEIDQRIYKLSRDWEEAGIGNYIVFEKQTERFVGRGGLRRPNPETNPDRISFLAGFLGRFQKKGYGTELGHFCLSEGFEKGINCFC